MQRAFKWDPVKARSNAIRHGISFKMAVEVFFDPDAVYFEDVVHSTAVERRDMVIGLSWKGVLLVVFTERHPATRIITARKANAHERRLYEEQQN